MKQHNGTTNQKFGLALGAVCLGIVIYWAFIKHQFMPVLLVISFIMIFAALFMPGMLTPFNRGWTKLSITLGKVNTWILLTLVYCLILTPLSVVIKLLGKDLLKLKAQKKASTYWEKATHVEESSMKRQF
ncbi:MAG: SxtJ family membrane protein [Pedobacter sp.]|uniref:SxtJ family membrane protein n=1 Tax=Pedobacter sp. TaxID=1411316 RepID=UPI00339AD5D6